MHAHLAQIVKSKINFKFVNYQMIGADLMLTKIISYTVTLITLWTNLKKIDKKLA